MKGSLCVSPPITCAQLLGPKYGGRDPRVVLGSEEYWHDVLDAGPAMGMTFMLAAARDMPISEASRYGDKQPACVLVGTTAHFCLLCRILALNLSNRMVQQGASTEAANAHIAALGSCLDAKLLASETRLLTPPGTHVRKGSVLMLTTCPRGGLVMQGVWLHG